MKSEIMTYPAFTPHFPLHEWRLPHILERQAVERAQQPFLQWTDANPPMSFSEVNRRVNRLAHGLAARGVRKGDRVAIFLPNCLEYILTWFALNKLGAAEVTIGDAFRGDFLAHQVLTSGAEIMITTTELVARVADIQERIPNLRNLFMLEDEPSTAAARFTRITTEPFSTLWLENEENPGIEVHPRDLAAVLFTSGTTGPSKAVMMPHSQIYFKAEEVVQILALRDTDVAMTGFPFFHANAQILSIYASMIVGIRCVLYRKFSASDWVGRLARSGATVTNCLGATMAFIAAQPERTTDRQHKLRAIYNAPTSPELAKLFEERFGIGNIAEGYGQTEISMPFLSPLGLERPAGACGLLVDQWFEVRLVDPLTGDEATPNAAGELWVRHKVPGIISDGFLAMPEKTLEAWRDLWFHTGDLMRRDAQGWYYFVDRLKDALRRRGENISSFEVESALRSHPSITECAIVAVPADEKGGEDEVLACIVLEHGAKLEPAELIAWCEPRMPGFAIPRYVRFMSALPQTPSEKIKKGELRAEGVTSDTWDSNSAKPELERQPAS